MQLSLKELKEISQLWVVLEQLEHIGVGPITIYDGMLEEAGTLTCDDTGHWGFEYGEDE